MIIPIALDFSKYNQDSELQHYGHDFGLLIACLESSACVLLYNGESLSDSILISQIELIPPKYRIRIRDLINRIPKKRVSGWNGIIDQNLYTFPMNSNVLFGVSKYRYFYDLNLDLDEVSARLPDNSRIEVTLWNSLQASITHQRYKALWDAGISTKDRLSVLWPTRFAAVLEALEWNSIIIVDRYLCRFKNRYTFRNMEFFLKQIDRALNSHSSNTGGTNTAVKIQFVIEEGTIIQQSNEFQHYYDHTEELIDKLDLATKTYESISEIKVYCLPSHVMQVEFHDRYMFLIPKGSDPVLFQYEIGGGFRFFGGNDRIMNASSFHFRMFLSHRDSQVYSTFLAERPTNSPRKLERGKVRLIFS